MTAPSRPPKPASAISKTFDSALSTRSFAGEAFGVEHRTGDLVARRDQLTQQRALANELRIRAHVRRRGRIAHERAEISESARLLQLAELLELLGDGDDVAGLAFTGERGDRIENEARGQGGRSPSRGPCRRPGPRPRYRAGGRR